MKNLRLSAKKLNAFSSILQCYVLQKCIDKRLKGLCDSLKVTESHFITLFRCHHFHISQRISQASLILFSESIA